MNEIKCNILIVGGSAGGTAAALAAASALSSMPINNSIQQHDLSQSPTLLYSPVCLIEETDWMGGQLTTQGVSTPDEQSHIETFGGTASYYQFRNNVRQHYKDSYNLTPSAKSSTEFNPGKCWVSRLSYEPKVGAAILREMVNLLEDSCHLRLFLLTKVTGCERDETGLKITTVMARGEDGVEWTFLPDFVLDATDLGEMLPHCGSEGIDWITGAESRTETGEPDAPDKPRLDWVQPFTYPFALDWSPQTAAANIITPPRDYEELKEQQNYHIKHGAITGLFSGKMPWWSYRRLLALENFDDPRIQSDLAMINTAGNDYYGPNIIGANCGNDSDILATLARARRVSLGYVYWLQTECPREPEDLANLPRTRDGYIAALSSQTNGYPELRLRTDLFDTLDGCSIRPYIRESRRIRSLRPILEQEIVVRDFKGGVCRGDNSRAVFMQDSVGIGHYALDIHPNGHGEPNAYVATRPFQIPLGALVPVRLQNFLPACKNLGTTHLTNGAYRLHPIEWNIGESAGHLAVFCLRNQLTSQEVFASSKMVHQFQSDLLKAGIPLNWFIDVSLSHPAFIAVQTLALTGIAIANTSDLLFHPDTSITADEWKIWRNSVLLSSQAAHVPELFNGSRAEAAIALFNILQNA